MKRRNNEDESEETPKAKRGEQTRGGGRAAAGSGRAVGGSVSRRRAWAVRGAPEGPGAPAGPCSLGRTQGRRVMPGPRRPASTGPSGARTPYANGTAPEVYSSRSAAPAPNNPPAHLPSPPTPLPPPPTWPSKKHA
ncbi:actin nucleation-promoting factor WAS-like [Penaeus indicus]|uniref:actin nucleation-promoting factor WAS-like n=1 Tax=Penaeus indicus TaxID=29960 RepID=UPI00300C3F51